MKKILKVISHSEDETQGLASKLIGVLREGDILILSGELGSGKTVFVRGLASALGIDDDLVNSPSYTMVNEYPGPHPLFHFDLYRLEDPIEIHELGWDEYLTRSGLIAVEWGEKILGELTCPYYLLEFETVSDAQREITVSAAGGTDG